MRLFILLFLPVLFACSPVQPSFEWDSQLEQLKSVVLKKACTDEDRDSFEELIESQSLVMDYDQMARSMQNMQLDIHCE